MKKIFFLILILSLLLSLTSCFSISGIELPQRRQKNTEAEETTLAVSAADTFTLTTKVKSAIMYCVEDKEILYQYEPDKRVSTASVSKLMTAVAALTYSPSSEVVTVGNEVLMVHPDSSLCYIKPGHVLTLYDLLTGLMLPSGNDAAYAVAVFTGRKACPDISLQENEAIGVFCSIMNDIGKAIGMNSSSFSTPDGWDADNHYSTAKDILTLTEYALKFPDIKEIISYAKKNVTFISGENITWTNSNGMMHKDNDYYIDTIIGGKTGMTDDSGWNISAVFEKDSKTYIIIALGCESKNDRYKAVSEMYYSLEYKS